MVSSYQIIKRLKSTFGGCNFLSMGINDGESNHPVVLTDFNVITCIRPSKSLSQLPFTACQRSQCFYSYLCTERR